MKVETILYPTDFSRCSKQALDHALFLATEFDADLHMLHAVVLHGDDPGDPERRFPGLAEIEERLSGLARSELTQLAAEPRKEGLTIYEKEERGFSAPEVILDYAQGCDADLIVMGTHGRRGPGRFLMGSVAERVVRSAACPVLTLREQKEYRSPGAIRSVLVPVDFSDHSTAGIQTAREFAARCDARVDLVHVVELAAHPTFYPTTALVRAADSLKGQAAEALTDLANDTAGPAVEVDTWVLEGRAADSLLAFSKEKKSDLIVIPTHGLGGVEHMLVGSTTTRVLRRAGCPVLTLKPFGRS